MRSIWGYFSLAGRHYKDLMSNVLSLLGSCFNSGIISTVLYYDLLARHVQLKEFNSIQLFTSFQTLDQSDLSHSVKEQSVIHIAANSSVLAMANLAQGWRGFSKPWGTPLIIGIHSDSWSNIATPAFRIYDQTQPMTVPCNLTYFLVKRNFMVNTIKDCAEINPLYKSVFYLNPFSKECCGTPLWVWVLWFGLKPALTLSKRPFGSCWVVLLLFFKIVIWMNGRGKGGTVVICWGA